jgi:subtilase family serine protease
VRFAVDGVQIAQPTIPAIGAGSVGHASTQWSTNGQNGDHTITVTADPANAIAESNETNNTASKAVTVKGKNVG